MFVRSTVALMFTSPPTPLLEDSILPKDKVQVKLPDGESMVNVFTSHGSLSVPPPTLLTVPMVNAVPVMVPSRPVAAPVPCCSPVIEKSGLVTLGATNAKFPPPLKEISALFTFEKSSTSAAAFRLGKTADPKSGFRRPSSLS